MKRLTNNSKMFFIVLVYCSGRWNCLSSVLVTAWKSADSLVNCILNFTPITYKLHLALGTKKNAWLLHRYGIYFHVCPTDDLSLHLLWLWIFYSMLWLTWAVDMIFDKCILTWDTQIFIRPRICRAIF